MVQLTFKYLFKLRLTVYSKRIHDNIIDHRQAGAKTGHNGAVELADDHLLLDLSRSTDNVKDFQHHLAKYKARRLET